MYPHTHKHTHTHTHSRSLAHSPGVMIEALALCPNERIQTRSGLERRKEREIIKSNISTDKLSYIHIHSHTHTHTITEGLKVCTKLYQLTF